MTIIRSAKAATAAALLIAGQPLILTPAMAAPKPPNIVIILADDMGFSDIGAYGGEIKTPNLDHLAETGKKFTQFYNTARCCPSRAALMTGLYPHQAGIGHLIFKTPYIGYGDYLTSDTATIPEVLHGSGYATYMLGKWHMAPRGYVPERDVEYWPTRRGFDKFYGTIAGSGSFYDPSTLCRGETYITPENDPEYKPEKFYYTDALSDNAIKFLDEHEAESADKPFFMYVAYTAAHWPLHAPEDAIAEYRGKYDTGYGPPHKARIKRLKELNLVPELGDAAAPVGDWAAIQNKPVETSLMETYAAMVTRMDQGIGKIVARLKENGRLNNTLIFYMQDNGGCAEDPFGKPRPPREPIAPMKPDELQDDAQPGYTREGIPVKMGHDIKAGPPDTYTAYKENWANVSNSPFRKYKHYVHEGGISTPLIANWPAQIHPTSSTQIVRTPAHLIDIMATVVDLANATYPTERDGVKIQPMEGVTLAPVLLDTGAVQRDEPIFFEHEGNRAVRDGKWKIVAVGDEPWELYDMTVDRGEMNNLAGAHPDIVKRMNDQWYAWAERARVLPLGGWKARGGDPDPDNFISSITLKQGDSLSRDKSLTLTNRGVNISAQITEGPVEGVIVSQGASKDGFALYAKDGKIVFDVRRGSRLHHVETNAPLPEAPFTVTVDYAKRGQVRLAVNDKAVTADFYGPLLLTPTHGASAGVDSGNPVGDYPKKFDFKGKLGAVKVETNTATSLPSATD